MFDYRALEIIIGVIALIAWFFHDYDKEDKIKEEPIVKKKDTPKYTPHILDKKFVKVLSIPKSILNISTIKPYLKEKQIFICGQEHEKHIIGYIYENSPAQCIIHCQKKYKDQTIEKNIKFNKIFGNKVLRIEELAVTKKDISEIKITYG